MQMLMLKPTTPSNTIPTEGMVSHDVRNPLQRSEVLVRKGSLIGAAEVAALLARGIPELHLAVPAPDDVGEDDAAMRLAAATAGDGVSSGTAHFGQVTLTSNVRGLVQIRSEVLEQVNRCAGVLVMTSLSDCAADTGTPLGVVKCAPLFMGAEVLQSVEALCRSAGTILDVEPFRPHRVAFVAPEERLRGNAFERATASLGQALEWYGSSFETVLRVQAATDSVASGYRQALVDGAELILAAGAAATDPLDVMFDGLRAAGGEVDQIGIPAEPGTACWFGRLDGRPVLGLASCELFGRPGALDLLLPQLLAGTPLDGQLIRRLALGGLLLGGPSRILPYHAAEATES
jgi:molybdenum cofactor cytidylyltransferase